jgi:hypothetical protein
MIRQGDVSLVPTAMKPSKQSKRVLDAGRVILAYGEVTGHAHVMVPAVVAIDNADPVAYSELFEEPDGTRLLVVKQPSALVHDEHDRIDIGVGSYRVIRQVEWSLDDVRQVAD